MKKIFYILTAAIVALGAVACDNQNLDNATPAGEGLTITASLEDIDRVAVDENNFTAAWDDNDEITIWHWDEATSKELSFTFKQESTGVFKCNDENTEILIGQTCYAFCGEFDSTKGLKGVEFGANGRISATGTELHFLPQQALLVVEAEGENITLKASENIFMINGSFANEVTLANGKNFVSCVSNSATITYYIGGEKGKSLSKTIESGKVYTLGTIAKPKASEYGVVGSFQGWDVAAPVVMYVEGDWAVAKGIELYKDDDFKIVKGKSWDVSYGLSAAGVLALDEEVAITSTNSQNMKAAKNGKFDIYFNATANKIKYTCVEEYTDLKVNITINNEAKWSPLSITLKDGSTTIVNNATVSNNVYAISGDYIGMSLSYTLTNGSKTSEGNVTITRGGAIINLVEQVIRITFVLDTNNTKTYWGTEAYIYIWNTDPSVNNSWPGTKMIYDGNYTFHYDLPASLKGKKLTYIINRQTNGNWQSKDSTIASLSLDGHTITGSSINIE